MKRKNLFSIIASLAIATTISAQTSDFKPSGKATAKVFADFFVNHQNSKTNSGFEINRAYFGYGYNFSEKFSGKVLLDVGSNSGGSAYTAFLKNALAEYKDKVVTIDLGMIGTDAFSTQESFFGRRYVQKMIQDYAGINSSADLGASIKIKAAPMLSFDAAILNGEGYKKVQADSTLKFTVGATLTPVKGLTARVYGDYLSNNKKMKPAGKDQTTFTAFLGYAAEKASLGAEYNYQSNSGCTKDKNLTAFSVYGSATVAPKWNIFARYDNLSSKDDVNATGSSIGKDGNLFIGGIEYTFVKGVRISPNFQLFDPKMDGGKNLATGFLNIEMAF